MKHVNAGINTGQNHPGPFKEDAANTVLYITFLLIIKYK